MSEFTIEEQVKESFLEAQLIDKKIETALKYMENTNPVERILKTIDPQDEQLRKATQERVQIMMQSWLQTYDNVLSEGKDLPKDLMGSAADLARKNRKKNNGSSTE
jgi:hypothetical protein